MNRESVKELLNNYHWLLNTLEESDHHNDIRVSVTAQGGIESSMPKAQGGTSDSVGNEALRRYDEYSWVADAERKVRYVQERVPTIKSSQQAEVLTQLMQGGTPTSISRNMGISRNTFNKLRKQIITLFMEY